MDQQPGQTAAKRKRSRATAGMLRMNIDAPADPVLRSLSVEEDWPIIAIVGPHACLGAPLSPLRRARCRVCARAPVRVRFLPSKQKDQPSFR